MKIQKKQTQSTAHKAHLEYFGTTGVTQRCKEALQKILQYGDEVLRVVILSHENKHGFYLVDSYEYPMIILPGFTTGYNGEGPRGFSYCLALLLDNNIMIDEVVLPKQIFKRLEDGALSFEDLEFFEKTRPLRPNRYYEYILDNHLKNKQDGTLWSEFKPVIPLGLVEPRLIKLARDFSNDPRDIVFKASRLLEDTVRRRIDAKEDGARVFSAAFHGNSSYLYWPNIETSEQTGRANLFTGAYQAYRNPKAHNERKEDLNDLMRQFLLINQLFFLESEATTRPIESKE